MTDQVEGGAGGVNRHWSAPKTEFAPCRICGWGPSRGIHSLIIYGPRKGEPWGHAYVPPADSAAQHQEGMTC